MRGWSLLVVVACLASTGASAQGLQPEGPPPLSAPAPSAPAVPSLPATPPSPERTVRQAYERERLGLQVMEGVDDDGQVTGSWLQPYQGKYRQPLDDDQFFLLVGRSDLADSYRSRQHVATGLLVGSAVVFVGSLGGGLYEMLRPGANVSDCQVTSPAFSTCIDAASHERTNRMLIGILGMTGGILVSSGLMTAGLVFNAHPASASQMRQLVDEYNQHLRERLGLPDEADGHAAAPAPEAPSVQLSLAPMLTATGVGLALSGVY